MSMIDLEGASIEFLDGGVASGGLTSFDKLNFEMTKSLYKKGWFSLWGEIEGGLCENASLFLLNSMFEGVKEVTFFVCSPGGAEDDARALLTAMEICKANGMIIRMMGAGLVASAAFDIFIAGTSGYRYMSNLGMFMTHSSSAETRDKSMMALQDSLDEYTLSHYTRIRKKTREQFLATGNWYFSAEEGLSYGACDAVIYAGKKLPTGPVHPSKKKLVEIEETEDVD